MATSGLRDRSDAAAAISPLLVFLVRHARPTWRNTHLLDHEQPLSERGKQCAAGLAQTLLREHFTPEYVLCSSSVRAVQTLSAFSASLPVDAEVHIQDSLYLAGCGVLLESLRHLPADRRSVMLIGHNPGLVDLASLLTLPGRASTELTRLGLPTAGLVVLTAHVATWRDLSPGRASITSLRKHQGRPPAPAR